MARNSHNPRIGPRWQGVVLLAMVLLLHAGTLAAEPSLIRVPPPSSRRYPLALGRGSGTADPSTRAPTTTGWWLGTAGMALLLAICGGVCVGARKYLPRDSSGLVQVVGRVSLSPRHSIYLVRAGRRTLIVGAGAQGSPTLLGELGELEPDQEQFTDRPSDTPATAEFPVQGFIPAAQRATPLIDFRLGEEA
jgi:flagellar protein FliO/FliZ